MANSPDFVTHALELLSGVGPVQARAMFGGHGVYARGVMFGLLDDDELFLKTDETSRPRFVEVGCRSWVYVGPNQRMENTSYYRPPDEAHEDPEAMLAWASLALESALRLRAARAPRPGSTSRAARKRGPLARATPAARKTKDGAGRMPAGGPRKAPKRRRGGTRPR